MTLREIRSNCGSLRFQTPKARLQSSSGLFLDFSWVAADAKVTELLPACRPPGRWPVQSIQARLSVLIRTTCQNAAVTALREMVFATPYKDVGAAKRSVSHTRSHELWVGLWVEFR